MRRFLSIYCLFVILALASTVQAGEQQVSYGPGNYTFDLTHDGLSRKYIVHYPDKLDLAPLPLIIALHGGGGNAQSAVDFFGINNLSDRNGFAVAYPEGTGWTLNDRNWGSWNAGHCCAPATETQVDDVGFIAKMLDRIVKDFSIDAQRIYAAGHSDGALMAYRLACDLSERIAAIATAGGHDGYAQCQAKRAIPVYHMHGTADQCMPFEGGQCGGCTAEFLSKIGLPLEQKTWDCSPVSDYIDGWRDFNGCASQSKRTYHRGKVTCRTFADCRDGAEVTLCTVKDMGHTWPGGNAGIEDCTTFPNNSICQSWRAVMGEVNTDLMANTAMLEFFQKFRLTPPAQ